MSALIEPPDGNQNRAAWLNSVAWAEVSVSTIFVASRLYSRIRITRNPGWDDWFIVITWGMSEVETSSIRPFVQASQSMNPTNIALHSVPRCSSVVTVLLTCVIVQ